VILNIWAPAENKTPNWRVERSGMAQGGAHGRRGCPRASQGAPEQAIRMAEEVGSA
jgi:hypothetical protein